MISVLPSSSAARRAWVCGESGLTLTTWARFQSRCPASFSAASFAPAKFGILPSAPGKRETPSRSIAFQTPFRTSSFDRTARNIPTLRAHELASYSAGMAERTSLAGLAERPEAEVEPRRVPARRRRELLPAIEPERTINDWGRSERLEEFFDRTLVEFFY